RRSSWFPSTIRSSAAGPPCSPGTSATVASLTRSSHPSTGIRPAPAGWSFVAPSVIPGFGLSLGYALTYLSLIVLIPIAALFVKAASAPLEQILRIATAQRTLNALSVSFGSSLVAALVNVVFGVVV